MRPLALAAILASSLAPNDAPRLLNGGIHFVIDDSQLEGQRHLRRAGSRVRVLMEAYDPEGAPLRYTWRLLAANQSPVSGALIWQSEESAVLRLPAVAGRFTVEAVARDPQGAPVRAVQEIETKATPDPELLAVPAATVPNPGSHLRRSLRLLAEGKPVRILFYGQSITKQQWFWHVLDDLARRFPKAKIEWDNRAIGGYSSPFLVRTVERDVVTFWPDLVIFHVYGPAQEYEEVIRLIRTRTIADLAIQNDHVNNTRADQQASRDRQSFEFLPRLAERYGAELVDIRRPWRQYLENHRLRPEDLQTDGVHLNAHGNKLMAALTLPYLVPTAGATHEPLRRIRNPQGTVTLDDAVRVEAEISGAGEVEFLLDGKRPSEHPRLWSYSRPNPTWDADWPGLNHVSWTTPPQLETWLLRLIDPAADWSRASFELTGTATGADGAGSTNAEFTSRSGRIRIEPRDWALQRSFNLHQAPMPAGFTLSWRMIPLHADRGYAGRAVVWQGLPAAPHRLEIRENGARVRSLIVSTARPL